MPEPVWVREDVVLAIHNRQLAEHGGLEGIRDQGLLASALARPRNRYAYSDDDPDIASLAASYAHAITSNHPFADGNKRTALVVCRTFLKLNGLDLIASQADKYDTFLALAAGRLSEKELADWIRVRTRKL
ncbi:MAG: type II toxin-antitoxin system death-on-curing family toxin [Phycisphaerae bacterium]